jgi:hypothetical protein
VSLGFGDPDWEFIWSALVGQRTGSLFLGQRAAGQRISWSDAQAAAIEQVQAEHPHVWAGYQNSIQIDEIDEPVIDEPEAEMSDGFNLDRTTGFLPRLDPGLPQWPPRRRSRRHGLRVPARWPL